MLICHRWLAVSGVPGTYSRSSSRSFVSSRGQSRGGHCSTSNVLVLQYQISPHHRRTQSPTQTPQNSSVEGCVGVLVDGRVTVCTSTYYCKHTVYSPINSTATGFCHPSNWFWWIDQMSFLRSCFAKTTFYFYLIVEALFY